MKPTLEQLKEQLNSLTEQIKKYESVERFEVGKWYNIKTSYKYLFNFQRFEENTYYGYGFNPMLNRWFNGSMCNVNQLVGFTPATTSEVEAALIAEAKKRGFKEGVWFNSIYSGSECYILNCKFEYKRDEPLLKNDALWIDGNTVYMAGQWATIIPQEEKIEIGGYEVKFKTNGHTSIDGNEFTKEFWIAAKTISEHSKAKIMVGCSKQFDVSLETINKILSKL